jgi:hypothetical protein
LILSYKLIGDDIGDPLMEREIASAAAHRVGEIDEIVDKILFLISPNN